MESIINSQQTRLTSQAQHMYSNPQFYSIQSIFLNTSKKISIYTTTSTMKGQGKSINVKDININQRISTFGLSFPPKHNMIVISQMLISVCALSPISGIYQVELGFINNCKELQL